jgi:hypothetical protein
MIKITIATTDVRNMTGVSKTSGKPYDLNFQQAWAHTVDKSGNPSLYPQKFELMLEKNAQGISVPYPVGEFQPAPSSIQIDRMGNIDFRPTLVPLKARS